MRVACGVFLIVALRAWWLAPADLGDATSERWSGVVEELAPGASSQRVTVSLDSPRGLRVALTVTDILPRLSAGDSVNFKAHLMPAMRHEAIPGMRMHLAGMRASRISATALAEPLDIRVTGHSPSLRFLFAGWRTRLAEAIYASPLSPEASRMLVASCLGASDAPADLKASFRSAGISHLLCVSGFHVGVVAAVLAILLYPLRFLRQGRRRGWLIIAVVWVYALAVGATAPVLRAAVMITAIYLAMMLQRGRAPANSLCVALTAVLLLDPYSLFSAGLQLSFAAVGGLLCFGVALNPVPRRYRFAHKLAAVVVVPAVVMMSTLPVVLAWFGYITFFSIPANALACLVFPVFMVGGALAAALWHTGVVVQPLITLSDKLAMTIERALEDTAPLAADSTLTLGAGTLTVACLCVALAALGCLLHLHAPRTRGVAAAVCAIALMCTGCETPVESTRIVFDGDRYGANLYISGAGNAIVYGLDGGGTPRFNPVFTRFMESGRPDSVRFCAAMELPHVMSVGGCNILFPDRDSDAADFSETDIIYIGRRFRGAFAPYARRYPAATVVLSPAARPEVAAEVLRECSSRGIACRKLAVEPVYMEFWR